MGRRAHTQTAELAARQNGACAVFESGGGADETERLMTIAEVAHQFGVTLRALRFYESKRLLAPARRGSARLYRRSDRDRLALVLTGCRLGFTLAEVKQLLDRPDGQNLHLTRDKCVEQINLLEKQKRGIELALGELRQIYTSFYQAVLDHSHP
jgi:DNA-binding transcriptional MerR regulator